MAATNPAGNESAGTTDPRDRNIHLGIDSHGEHHVYQTRFERVVVIDPGAGIELVQPLGTKTVDDWMDHVEENREWAERNYGVPLSQMLADGLEADR